MECVAAPMSAEELALERPSRRQLITAFVTAATIFYLTADVANGLAS